MGKESFNPGLSEDAWDKLHILMTRLSIKYAEHLREDAKPKTAPRKRNQRASSIAN